MNFELKNPNKSLTTYGIVILIINVILIITPDYFFTTGSNPIMLVLGFGLIIKILVLLWIPKAASLVGRHPAGWTIFCFLTPSVGLIMLGTLGYKKTPGIIKLIEDCTKSIEHRVMELELQKQKGALDEIQFEQQLNDFIEDINDFAAKQADKIYNTEDDNFLTEELIRKGFVLNEDSDVFVPVEEKCPACGAKISKNDKICPECNLVFEPED